jgi:hypothetical protein
MKNNVSKWAGLAAVVTIAGLLATGCAWSIGGKGDAKTVAQPTKGQELVDLKKAKDQGAISDADYEAQRAKILGR